MRKWQFITILLLLFIVSSCATQHDFYEKINIVNTALDESDWQKAKKESEQIKAFYDDTRWKLQLLGDEREYDGIREEIEKLLVSIDEKDKTQAKIAAVTIRSYIEEIYLQ